MLIATGWSASSLFLILCVIIAIGIIIKLFKSVVGAFLTIFAVLAIIYYLTMY